MAGTTINDDPVVEFVLEVTPPDGEPYTAHTKGLVSRLDIPALQPGRVFPVANSSVRGVSGTALS